MEYEEILKSVGEFGIYQKVILVMLAVYAGLQGVNTNMWNFLSPHQPHWCHIEQLQNFTEDQQKYIAIPYKKGSTTEYEQCKMFNLTWSSYSQVEYESWNRSVMTAGGDTLGCRKWFYDYTTLGETIRSEVSELFLNYVK